MECFQLFEAAARYVWEQPEHPKSHISTRIIPAVHGESGNYHMYDEYEKTTIFVSPLMNLYWFFDANTVIRRSLIIETLKTTYNFREAFLKIATLERDFVARPRRSIPY